MEASGPGLRPHSDPRAGEVEQVSQGLERLMMKLWECLMKALGDAEINAALHAAVDGRLQEEQYDVLHADKEAVREAIRRLVAAAGLESEIHFR